jgi:hypothetical protein
MKNLQEKEQKRRMINFINLRLKIQNNQLIRDNQFY